MSDMSESKMTQQLESLRIRKMYSVRTPRSRISDSIQEAEVGDYTDEKDFQHTDR